MSDDRLGFRCIDVACAYESRRGSVQALDRVTFAAQSHEFIGIVGPSGCGKTTLLRIIAGLQQPSAGRVEFERDFDGGRPHRGLVFQEFGTFPWLTVIDNLSFGLEMGGVPARERRERALAFADRLRLGGFLHHYPGDLSTGMRQRVDIGRAFVSGAPLLLMDEPFGALDAQTKWVLQEELLRIWQVDRKLVVFITHDIEEAVRLSDRVLVMSGRPGVIRAEIPVPLPRPRDIGRDYQQVREVAWQIWQLLEEEVRSGLSVAPRAP
jgi:NitT/TauT family transport system ATP-binding protein